MRKYKEGDQLELPFPKRRPNWVTVGIIVIGLSLAALLLLLWP